VRTSDESWLLWDFDCLRAPKFEDDNLKLGEDSMVKVQHWKIFAAYYGGENVSLSKKILELVALQKSYEGCGMPVSSGTFNACVQLPKPG